MSRIFILLIPALLSACVIGPNHRSPIPEAPEAWHTRLESGQASASESWWQAFGDEKLNQLIGRALTRNRDLKIAEARLREARALRQSTASALFPQLDASARANRMKEGFPSGLLGGGAGAGASRIPSFDKPLEIEQAGFDASWEIDLFGGTRRNVEAAKATAAARAASLRDVTIALIGDVARGYIEWRQLQQQTQLAEATAKAQQQLFEMTRQRFEAGLASRFELLEAQTLAMASAARIPEWQHRLEASGYHLSVLLGENAGALNDELKALAPLPQPIALPALGAPADTLRHRPDVETAERELAAATALQGAALAELFPKLTLSGLFGVQDTNFGDPTRIWSIGGGVAMPLLNFGRIQGQIKQADARQQQAFFTYQKTVLEAVSEIEAILSAIAHGRDRVAALTEASDGAFRTVTLARLRFAQGVSSFTDVLTAEQHSYTAQDELVQARGALLANIIRLHKALGLPTAR